MGGVECLLRKKVPFPSFFPFEDELALPSRRWWLAFMNRVLRESRVKISFSLFVGFSPPSAAIFILLQRNEPSFFREYDEALRKHDSPPFPLTPGE